MTETPKTTMRLNEVDLQKALAKARSLYPGIEFTASSLVRMLIREFNKPRKTSTKGKGI
jgi:hypothetical protein